MATQISGQWQRLTCFFSHKFKNENQTTGFEVRNTFNDKEFAEFTKNAKFDFIKYFHFSNNVDFEIQLKEHPETDYEGKNSYFSLVTDLYAQSTLKP